MAQRQDWKTVTTAQGSIGCAFLIERLDYDEPLTTVEEYVLMVRVRRNPSSLPFVFPESRCTAHFAHNPKDGRIEALLTAAFPKYGTESAVFLRLGDLLTQRSSLCLVLSSNYKYTLSAKDRTMGGFSTHWKRPASRGYLMLSMITVAGL